MPQIGHCGITEGLRYLTTTVVSEFVQLSTPAQPGLNTPTFTVQVPVFAFDGSLNDVEKDRVTFAVND